MFDARLFDELVRRGFDAKPESYTLKMTDSKPTGAVKRPEGLAAYQAELKWREPFVTRRPQTLRLEIETWSDAAGEHNYVFMCASPQKADAEVWSQMRKIRAGFAYGMKSETADER